MLAIRSDLDQVRDQVNKAIGDRQVQIAFRVLHEVHDTPATPTTGSIMKSLERRLERLEQEIFSESIRLDVERGTLYVDVVVGTKSTQMVVDSGATLVSLPPETANQLGISIPSDAPTIRMVLADGRTIAARAVTIPKLRVGQFEAENVDAAVLDTSAVMAEPLLGMSFLGNFKFEVDAGEKNPQSAPGSDGLAALRIIHQPLFDSTRFSQPAGRTARYRERPA